MNEHVSQWIAAYHDGELSQPRRAKVSAHLEGCESCRRELQQVEELSALLQTATVPDYPRSERFAANVRLRLPRTAAGEKAQHRIKLAWGLGLAGVIGLWAFMQAVLITTGISFALGIDRVLQAAIPSLEWTPGLAAGGFFSGEIAGVNLAGFGSIETSLVLFTIEVIVSIAVAGLLAGWLAGWLSFRRAELRNQQSN